VDVSVEQETFVSLGADQGDVKIVVAAQGPAARLSIQPVSDMEIAAKDIRARFDQPPPAAAAAVQLMAGGREAEPPDTWSTTSSSHSFVMVETAATPASQPDQHQPLLSPHVITLVVKVKEFSLALTDDLVNFEDIQEVVRITASDVRFLYLPDLTSKAVLLAGGEGSRGAGRQHYSLTLEVGDLQADNQIYERGLYHFPVLLHKQEAAAQPLLRLHITVCHTEQQQRFLQTVSVAFSPVCLNFEDTLFYVLKEYSRQLAGVGGSGRVSGRAAAAESLPLAVALAVRSSRSFHLLNRLSIEPIQLQLNVHASVKLSLGLEDTHLELGRFQRSALWVSNFGLGGVLSHHYLSGALFKAGWVVGSLDMIGSPATFTRNVSEGLKDFIALPFEGIFNGPWGFILGLSQGSSSLVKHVSAGTVTSLTNFCQSVSRNLDMVSFDEEHCQRNQAVRRAKPRGLSEGIMKGLSGIGVSLLGAIGGLAHHPIQVLIRDGLSPLGLVGGMSKGLVGIVAKPLGGAAEFIAQTGQGLLAGSGWTRERKAKRMCLPGLVLDQPSSELKFAWKMPDLGLVLCSLEAVLQEPDNQLSPVTCLVTTDSLVIVNDEEDVVAFAYSVQRVSVVTSVEDPTLVEVSVHKQSREDEEEGGDEVGRLFRTTDRTAQFVLQSLQYAGTGEEEEPGAAALPGQPPALLGQPPALLGQPPALLGQPPALLGQPPALLGQPPALLGQPPALLGKPPALLGQPPAQIEARHRLFLSPGLVEWLAVSLESAKMASSSS
jgi:vacuolar protein sorting-associated protein 13B